MRNLLKGMIVGLGAVTPGLSGSVLLVIFGLYQKTISAISSLFKDFKNNVKFLFPLVCGMALGIIAFSNLVDFLLRNYEMPTRFGFLGLILGSIPLFYRQVMKKGFHKKNLLLIAAAFAVGMVLFGFNRELFPVVTEPTVGQSVLLGVAVASSYIVPGVDSAAILSALGFYDLWVHSLATLNLTVLFPAVAGGAVAVLAVSFVMDWLIRKFYTPTFSVIFGLFLSVVPAVVDESCIPGWNLQTYVACGIFAVCFAASLLFSRLSKE